MKRSQTAYVILGILAIHDNQSGYEIRKTIQQTVGFFWGESFGQIYPTLKKLLADGLIAPAKSRRRAQTKAARILDYPCRARLPSGVAGRSLPRRSAPRRVSAQTVLRRRSRAHGLHRTHPQVPGEAPPLARHPTGNRRPGARPQLSLSRLPVLDAHSEPSAWHSSVPHWNGVNPPLQCFPPPKPALTRKPQARNHQPKPPPNPELPLSFTTGIPQPEVPNQRTASA